MTPAEIIQAPLLEMSKLFLSTSLAGDAGSGLGGALETLIRWLQPRSGAVSSASVGLSASISGFLAVLLGVRVRANAGGRQRPLFPDIEYLRWLWRCSTAVIEDKPLRAWRYRARFLHEGWRHAEALQPFRNAPPESPLGRAMRSDRFVLDAMVRPYQSIAWDTPTRLRKLREHIDTTARLGWPTDVREDDAIALMPLTEIHPELSLVIDQAIWFQREGPLVLNIFLRDMRLFSLAFALRDEGGLVAHVGAIQGGNQTDVLDIYRDLTKAAHGMRPRDLMIELFQSFCQTLGVKRITLVSDSHRQHRHSYFGDKGARLAADYDAIWIERGAERVDETTFEMSAAPIRRPDEEVPARKRSLYRKRYAMLDALEQRLRDAMADVQRIPARHRAREDASAPCPEYS